MAMRPDSATSSAAIGASLRHGARTAQQALLEADLHFAHPVGERDDGLRCGTDIGAVIVGVVVGASGE